MRCPGKGRGRQYYASGRLSSALQVFQEAGTMPASGSGSELEKECRKETGEGEKDSYVDVQAYWIERQRWWHEGAEERERKGRCKQTQLCI